MTDHNPASPNAGRRFPAAVSLTALAVLALGGCADVRRSLTPAPVNVESPVAAQVQSALTRSYALPLLTDVPPPPRNVPLAPYVKNDVVAMVRCRRAIDSFPQTHPPLSGGAEQFATDERTIAQVNPADIPPSDQVQISDAAAAELRAYAAPPAAIASGPPPTPAEAQPPAAPSPAAPHSSHARTSGRHAAAPAVAAASPTPTTEPTVPAGAATPNAAGATADVPALPAPLTDPLLARCT